MTMTRPAAPTAQAAAPKVTTRPDVAAALAAEEEEGGNKETKQVWEICCGNVFSAKQRN